MVSISVASTAVAAVALLTSSVTAQVDPIVIKVNASLQHQGTFF